jgi:hypothetical protein
MVGEPQGAMCVVLQIWQVVFASQTLPVFCLALRKKAQYVVVNFAIYVHLQLLGQPPLAHKENCPAPLLV